jgi:uncharacterized protein (AIM24 family)
MTIYSIAEFLRENTIQEPQKAVFERAGERLLVVNLNGLVWVKAGSMVAYRGNVRYTREGFFEHGIGHFLKGAMTGEAPHLMKAEGRGQIYLADTGKKLFILDLQGQAIRVNGNDVLAFVDGVRCDIALMKKVAGMLAGGLFSARLEGSGLVAITTHYEPLVLDVRPGYPVVTDPNATVAWSDTLEPKLRVDVSLRTLIGRGSGESLQMCFEGEGWVLVQPYEEINSSA